MTTGERWTERLGWIVGFIAATLFALGVAAVLFVLVFFNGPFWLRGVPKHVIGQTEAQLQARYGEPIDVIGFPGGEQCDRIYALTGPAMWTLTTYYVGVELDDNSRIKRAELIVTNDLNQ